MNAGTHRDDYGHTLKHTGTGALLPPACIVSIPDDPAWGELAFPVMGAVSGMLGCIMAMEAIKLLTGYGTPLLSQMLIFNTYDMEFRKVNIRKDDSCPVCGTALVHSLP